MRDSSRLAASVAPTRSNATRHLARIIGGSLVFWCAWTAGAATSARAQSAVAPLLSETNVVARTEPGAISEKPAALDAAPDPVLPDLVVTADARIKALGYDPAHVREAVAAYRAGHVDAGDALVAQVADPKIRTALEWVALHGAQQSIGFARLQAFATAHPDWPAATWLRHQMEARLIRSSDPETVELFFTTRAPETPTGKLALAKALTKTGRVADGTKLARAVFRENDLPPYLETWLQSEFGGELTRGDYKYRADRLFYKGRVGAALRYAAQAGPEVLAIAKARAAIMAERSAGKTLPDVPAAFRADPGVILAEVHRLRRAGKLITAAQLLRNVTPEQTRLADGDDWWTERRMLARALLDAGKPNAAYITCAMHAPASRDSEVEAEFHAGWIALRFMHDPERAAYHFWAAAKHAQTPNAIARVAYWRGRAAEASDDPLTLESAKTFYETAGAQNATYYGQLARQALGLTTDVVQKPAVAVKGAARAEAIGAIELLYAAGDKDSATTLAVEAAGTLSDPAQVAALADVVSAEQDAHLSLTIGKLVGQRGISVDELAFPAFGVPSYKELANSASLTVVYSVARQESAFITRAVSSAHANGLMQMIDATARQTARKAGLAFSHARLLHDAAFNAQLGAAHLGTLMSEHGDSLILTFAAYNAGGGRVQEWIDEYGDPRDPGVDPIDWVERIPFTETRNYVQRVMANVAVYRAIFAEKAKADAIARRGREARL